MLPRKNSPARFRRSPLSALHRKSRFPVRAPRGNRRNRQQKCPLPRSDREYLPADSTGAEKFVFAKKQRAMLAFLDRYIARSIFANFSSGPNKAGFLRHLARFAIV